MKRADIPWRLYLRIGLGRRLSIFGERLGAQWLIYNPLQFASFHDEAVRSSPGVVRSIRGVFPQAKRWLDVGAGSGAYAAQAIREGIDAVACEHSAIGRRWARRQGVDCKHFDLLRDRPAKFDKQFDLAYCFEVAEHLPPALGDRLVSFIARCAPRIVFSAAHPNQGGTGHVNEQPKSYWIERFRKTGMNANSATSDRLVEAFRNERIGATWLIENTVVFER